jgi:hypothetical protein
MPQNVTPRAHSGTPFEPLGNPLTSGVGPAGYAQRADRPGDRRSAQEVAPRYRMPTKPALMPLVLLGHRHTDGQFRRNAGIGDIADVHQASFGHDGDSSTMPTGNPVCGGALAEYNSALGTEADDRATSSADQSIEHPRTD